MATALPIATDFTGASVTEAQLKTALTSQRAALAEIGDPMGRSWAIQNMSLVFTVAANALTCNVKTRAGAVPSATDPVTAAMRSATLSTGDFNIRNITAALSLVISSGSTLGHQSATPGFIYWYFIDNAGTLELAASTTYLGVKGIVTTVAEGGAGGADTATVTYSTTARASVPFVCVGRTTDTQTTAGTWTAVPSTVELSPFDAPIGVKVGSFTRDISTASGTQAVTGVGFQPRAVVFLAGIAAANTTGLSIGIDDGSTAGAVYNNSAASSPNWGASTTSSIAIAVGVSTNAVGLITSFGSDGFTITWTKTGSPTGTYTIGYMAFR